MSRARLAAAVIGDRLRDADVHDAGRLGMIFTVVDVADGRRVDHHIRRDGVEGLTDLRRLFQIEPVPDEAGPPGERLFSGKRVNFPIARMPAESRSPRRNLRRL